MSQAETLIIATVGFNRREAVSVSRHHLSTELQVPLTFDIT